MQQYIYGNIGHKDYNYVSSEPEFFSNAQRAAVLSHLMSYDVFCNHGELTTSAESTEVIWATPEEAFRMITFPLTKKRLQQMLSESNDARLFCFKRENGFEVIEDSSFSIGQ